MTVSPRHKKISFLALVEVLVINEVFSDEKNNRKTQIFFRPQPCLVLRTLAK
ncbi:hypothetical protein IMCC14465_02950 [alpha proteobacterium IMCC14465]|uniref:Uncharacterized protein n=1 Tax=alpha proteobacterium IMCC14465 TaxID=1220535 RepID=J9DIZ5_9PROT|nr:hypothetical protein IMCC14465_02950 [alpha proteobacterium IMCC14465]